jgi:hypothetical protein
MVISDSLRYPKVLHRAVSQVYLGYPKLHQHNLQIIFDADFGDSFMQAQPLPSTIFKSRGNRAYVIKVKPLMPTGGDTLFIHQVPDSVLQGWIAHEMGHLMDYRKRSGFGLIWLGIKYSIFDDYTTQVEKAADIYAIKAGFAKHLIATKKFIATNGNFPEWYLEKIEAFYLSPEEIENLADDLEP